MSEVEGLVALGLLPNQLRCTQPTNADSICPKVIIPMSWYGNLTGPTSVCWRSSAVGMQNSLLASVAEKEFRTGHPHVAFCAFACSAASGVQKHRK